MELAKKTIKIGFLSASSAIYCCFLFLSLIHISDHSENLNIKKKSANLKIELPKWNERSFFSCWVDIFDPVVIWQQLVKKVSWLSEFERKKECMENGTKSMRDETKWRTRHNWKWNTKGEEQNEFIGKWNGSWKGLTKYGYSGKWNAMENETGSA